ncbi:MAG: luxQ 2 [Polaromonas sp.]|nr:luxQ 2 [Polaromonas sp.]
MSADHRSSVVPEVSTEESRWPLEAVLCTTELHQRPPRPPDYETENRALVAMAHVLAEEPHRVLQALSDMALEIFKVDSAGISLLSDDQSSFFWPAISGGWQAHIGSGVARHASPCGTVLEHNAGLLFIRFDRHYAVPEGTPLPEEALLVPFGMDGSAIGTLWLITHGPDRHFDAEDLRQLQSLARFASAAYRVVKSAEAIQIKSQLTMLLLDKATESSNALRVLHGQFQESEERYRTVFEALDDSFCIFEKVAGRPSDAIDFRYLDVNPAFVAQAGSCDASSVVGRTLRQMYPGISEEWYLAYDAVLNSGEPLRFEHEMTAGTLWVELHAFRMPGKSRDRLAVIFKNITQRNLAELATRKSEAFNRSIIDGSPDCIKVLDLQGNLLRMLSGQTLLGIEDISPFLNKPWLGFWTGEDRCAAEAAVTAGASGNKAGFGGFFKTFKGEPKWWDVAVTPIQGPGGEPNRLLVVSRDVTHRKAAEDALQYRTVQFEQLVNEAPLGVYMVDADFRVWHVNPVALPSFGPIEALIGMDFEQVMYTLWPKAEAVEIVRKFRHTLATGESFVVPELISRREDKDGEDYFEWQIHRLPLQDGRYGVVCYFSDISKRVNAARQALAASERYRNLLASINEGYCVVELVFDAQNKPIDFVYLETNPAFEKLTGMRQALGKRVRELVPDLEDHWFETLGQVVLTGKPIRMTNEARAMDRWFDMYAFRMGETSSRKAVMLFNNITEQKKTEVALRDSEALYRSLFSSMDEGFCVIEMVFSDDNVALDYRFLEVNPIFEKQTGLVDATGRLMRELAPDHEQSWFDLYGQVALTGEPVRIQLEGKALQRWFDIQAFRIGGPGSLKVAIIFNNVTNRIQAEQTMKAQAMALIDIDRRKDEFLAMLSHELRNPLAAISNATHLLQLKKDDDPLLKQARGIIERQVGQLTHLVNDLLEISRITTGRVQLRLEQVAVQGIVERALETTQPLMLQRGHKLTVSLPPAPLWLYADAARLEQVLVNLVTNAAKYTEERGQIAVTVQQEGAIMVLRVSDTGLGIPAELLPKIFDLFTQAERSLDRSDGGLGIGLCLVQRLVELHGGEVEAHSVLGKGSEFVVRLPMMAAITEPRVSPNSALAIGDSPPLRLLVVDDNVDAARSLGDILSLVGHEVRLSHDGLHALKAALDWRPDVVLLDIGLPLMNGLEVARRIRAQPGLPPMVLVALTGYGQEADRQLSLEAGFEHHLVKPADFREVELILGSVSQSESVRRTALSPSTALDIE